MHLHAQLREQLVSDAAQHTAHSTRTHRVSTSDPRMHASHRSNRAQRIQRVGVGPVAELEQLAHERLERGSEEREGGCSCVSLGKRFVLCF